MKRFTGILVALVLVCTCFLGLTGCKSSKIDKDGNITLEYWGIYPVGDPNYEWMVSKVEQFEAANPKVNINYTGISFWDYFTKITVSQADPKGPDIFIQTVTDNGLRANGGLSLDITNYLGGDLTVADFTESDAAALTHGGKVYGVPYSTDGRILYYNKDLVNELKDSTDAMWTNTKAGKKQGTTITGRPADLIDAGDDVRAPKTYDEIMAYTELLTKFTNNDPVGGNITQLGFSPKLGNNNIMNFAWNMGAEFFDANGNPIVSTNAKIREAFQIWSDIANVFNVAKVNSFVDSGADVSNTTGLFWSGKVALVVETNEIPWKNDKLASADRINLGAACVPYTNEQYRSNFSGGFSLEIANRLKKEDDRVAQAAYDFVKFLMSDEVQKEVMTETGNMPGKVTVYEALNQIIDDPVKQFVISEMNYRKPYDFVPKAPQWWAPVFDNLNDYIAKQKTLDEALTGAQSGIQTIINIH